MLYRRSASPRPRPLHLETLEHALGKVGGSTNGLVGHVVEHFLRGVHGLRGGGRGRGRGGLASLALGLGRLLETVDLHELLASDAIDTTFEAVETALVVPVERHEGVVDGGGGGEVRVAAAHVSHEADLVVGEAVVDKLHHLASRLVHHAADRDVDLGETVLGAEVSQELLPDLAEDGGTTPASAEGTDQRLLVLDRGLKAEIRESGRCGRRDRGHLAEDIANRLGGAGNGRDRNLRSSEGI